MNHLDIDTVIESLKPAEPFVSRRPVSNLPATPEAKLYSVIIKSSTSYLVFLTKCTSRIVAENVGRKYAKIRPDCEVYGVNLVDRDRLESGELVHIF